MKLKMITKKMTNKYAICVVAAFVMLMLSVSSLEPISWYVYTYLVNKTHSDSKHSNICCICQ